MYKANALRSAYSRIGMSKAAEGRVRAWEYYKLGASLRAIAKKEGKSHETIRRYIQRSLDDLKKVELQSADEWRRLEDARLGDLMVSMMPRAISGNYQAAATVLKIMERRARLLGLDSPTEMKIDHEFSPEALARMSLEDMQAKRDEGVAQLVAAGALPDQSAEDQK